VKVGLRGNSKEERRVSCMTKHKMTNLQKELESVLNKASRENESNTPDFILAEFMLRCLIAFESASKQREAWYGKAFKIKDDTWNSEKTNTQKCQEK
jgi:hypothetical protein